jgi:hypothetical protein
MLAPITIKTPTTTDTALVDSFKRTLDALGALIAEGNAIVYCHEELGEDADPDEITKLAEKIANVATNGPPSPAEELVRTFEALTNELDRLSAEAAAIMNWIEANGLDAETVREMEKVAADTAFLVTDLGLNGAEAGLVGEVTDALVAYETGEEPEPEGDNPVIEYSPGAVKLLLDRGYVPAGFERIEYRHRTEPAGEVRA